MSRYPVIRTIYLYLFSLVGLVLLIVGSVGFINMGLKAFVFTQADELEYHWRMEPPALYLDRMDGVEEIKSTEGLNEEQLERIDEWLIDYDRWQAEQESFDPVIAERHRSAAINLASILVGLPLFLFHWLTIRRENKGK